RQAILFANSVAGADTIGFQAGLSGTITLSAGELGITDDLTIIGPGAGVLSVSGNNASRIFYINDGDSASDLDVAISGLTLTGGYDDSSLGGGAIRNSEDLTLTNCTLSGNFAVEGGGISTDRAATLTNCTVSGNTGHFQGGGIRSYPSSTL